MDNDLIQYILVAVILAGAVAWVIYRLVSKKNRGGGCCGCSMSQTCGKRNQMKEKCGQPEENCGKTEEKCGKPEGECHCKERQR